MSVDPSALARSSLFAGLSAAELALVGERAHARELGAGEALCRAGEPSERCWVITAGLVDVLDSSGQTVARRRKGATVGEVGAILGEPRRETLVASIPTSVLELEDDDLGELVRRFPAILVNALRTLHDTLTHARALSAERERGETVALAIGPSLRAVQAPLLAAARAATPRSVIALDRQHSFAGALTTADELVFAHATVLLPGELDPQLLAAHLREADRVLALVGSGEEARSLATLRGEGQQQVEAVLVGEEAAAASRGWPARAPLRVVRRCERDADGALGGRELAWLARHLTRTKLGLALGAGGAKGYAHVGVLQVLEQAGYTIDCVAGSSIGAIVAAYLALGADAAQIDATLRASFDEQAVAEIFKVSLAGRGGGLETMTRLLRETTGESTFEQTSIPLTVMAVDLTERAPAPLRSGPLWQALLAATALAGVFPPHERDGHRLVDGLALVPVPTAAVVQDGADVTVSVNLIGRETLDSWPSAPEPQAPAQRRRPGVLDNLLEVMDLSQLSESVRNAELADVVVTPRFGPGGWRDFHLADLFLAAGRAAAQEQLPTLASLASPAGAQG